MRDTYYRSLTEKGVLSLEETPIIFQAPEENTTVAVIDQFNEAKEIASVEKQLDASILIRNSLGKVKEIVENSLDDSGLKEEAAALLEVATRNSDLIEHEEQAHEILPSAENFVYVREREKNTHIALEAINDKLKSLWQWFIKALLNIKERIKTFLEKNTISLNFLLKRIGKLKERLSTLSQNNPNRTLKSPQLEKQLAVNGRFSFNLEASVTDLQKVFSSILSVRDGAYLKQVSTNFKAANKNPDATLTLIKSIYTLPTPLSLHDRIVNTGFIKSVETDPLLGDRVISFNYPNTDSINLQSYQENAANFGMKVETREINIESSGTIRILSIRQLEKLLAQCEAIVNQFIQYKDSISSIYTSIDELRTFANTMLQSNKEHEHSLEERVLQSITLSLPKLFIQPVLEVGRYTASSVNAITRYVDLATQSKE